ncbi:LrgB-like family-domain-containing protein [Pyronema omphalodes]|nr:LrgB-like family-domain-containing protein [Pyronema omphalodes]
MALRTLSFDKALHHDVKTAIGICLKESWPRLVKAWIYVPFGVVVAMLILWGIDCVIQFTGIAFPASVAGMLILFGGLIGLEATIGERKVREIFRVIDVPGGFMLKYINICFVPSFVLLPLSPSVGPAEIGKIVAVFFIGFIGALIGTIYVVRGLQAVLPKPKHENEESDTPEAELIPLTNTPGPSLAPSTNPSTAPSLMNSVPSSVLSLLPPLPAPAAETQRLRGAGPVCSRLPSHITAPRHSRPTSPTRLPSLLAQLTPPPSPPPPSRAEILAASLSRNFDVITYAVLFAISLPIMYTTGYAMPAHMTMTTLLFLLALPFFKKSPLLHPVLTSAAGVILGIYILSTPTYTPFKTALHEYRVGTKYLALFRGLDVPAPGAGDILSSLLDVSIVALALPMYTHRRPLLQHFPLILIPSIFLAAGNIILYPLIGGLVGISAPRSIAFAGRSVTLALATPAVQNFGGDTQFLAVLCVTTGIFAVLAGPKVLQLCKVGENEYIVRGIAFGGNGSAVATAFLLGKGEPRAAAMGSLAMVFFGITVVIVAAIGPVRSGVIGLLTVGK